MVTVKVYVDDHGFVSLINASNFAIDFERTYRCEASFKKTRKFKYEVQVPIQIIGQFLAKNMTMINIYDLQQVLKNKG